MKKTVTPYQDSSQSKKEQVTEMFDNISGGYDTLNHTLTMGIDFWWRKKAVQQLADTSPKLILDIATGTADFAISAIRLNPDKVIGLDISPKMLAVGREKISKKGLDKRIELIEGDSENLPFPDNHVDAVTVGFGVRNFENLSLGLSEIHRVMRPGAKAVILEPAFPKSFPLKQLFAFYFRYITPLIGKMISGDDAAYTYLPESVRAFPEGEGFLAICREVGFAKGESKPMTLGSCAMYVLTK
ncbi:MAG: bifunctional demethylmenaquinone methyltransferase/2-methoxy-6-polyprenyl-1,4-benzoquinol methylase UbiE [Bacteroidota bacterium]